MINILDQIVAAKKTEVEEKKRTFDKRYNTAAFIDINRTCISLKDNLMHKDSTGIIAEFKRKSPSKGWFKDAEYPAKGIVNGYEKNRAAGISILSDNIFFGGDINDISTCRVCSKLPILRKDFILDEIQVMEAKACGADVILLIAAILSPQRVTELACAAKKLGLEVLLEIHKEDELEHICDEVDMIGINNRNLKTFKVDIEQSVKLSMHLPAGKIKISESGIDTVETINMLKNAGFKGFLIGEKFMKTPDPVKAFEHFVDELVKA